MATEVQIRQAVVDRIKAVTVALIPAPVVLGRDILDIYNVGWMNVLRDANQLIHGWTVTQSALALREKLQHAAEYWLIYDVWFWWQYATGSDAQNSENTASAEIEIVVDAFKDPLVLVPILQDAEPLDFSENSIATVENDFRGQVKVAKGRLRVPKIYGCS